MHRLAGALLGIALLVVVLGIAGLTWWMQHGGEAWLDRTAEARILAAVDQASVPGYRFTLGHLKADARHGSLIVSDAQLDFEPRLLDSLRTGAYRYLFAAEVGKVELHGLSFWRLLLQGEFHVEDIQLLGPELHYYTGPKRVDLADPFKRLGGDGSKLLSVLVADTLSIRDANATVQDLNHLLPELKVNGLNIGGKAVRITARGRRSGVRLSVGEAELDLDSIGTLLPDGSRLHIGAVYLSRASRRGRLMDIRITPPTAAGRDTLPVRKSVMALSVDSILMDGLDLDRSIADEALLVHRVSIRGLHMEVELDKTLPMPARSPMPLPPAALAAMPFSIHLDTVQLMDADVRYRERDPQTARWGEVPFTGMNARFQNITNDRGAATSRGSITGSFSGTFFDSARVQGRYAAALDGSQRFTLAATLTGLPLTALNRASRPLMRIQMQQGILHRLDFRMEANARRAKGDLAMDYSGLLVRVEPGTPSELRHSMFGSVMDAMLSQAYGGGMSADRERNYTVERDPDRSVFNYVWHATREGLVRNLMPEAKERMRTMLRKDAAARKEERATRKAKREAHPLDPPTKHRH